MTGKSSQSFHSRLYRSCIGTPLSANLAIEYHQVERVESHLEHAYALIGQQDPHLVPQFRIGSICNQTSLE